MQRDWPLPELILSAEEKSVAGVDATHKTTQASDHRAKDHSGLRPQGIINVKVARRLQVTQRTVGKWRSRFVTRRLDVFLDQPRPDAPRQIGVSKWSASRQDVES